MLLKYISRHKLVTQLLCPVYQFILLVSVLFQGIHIHIHTDTHTHTTSDKHTHMCIQTKAHTDTLTAKGKERQTHMNTHIHTQYSFPLLPVSACCLRFSTHPLPPSHLFCPSHTHTHSPTNISGTYTHMCTQTSKHGHRHTHAQT